MEPVRARILAAIRSPMPSRAGQGGARRGDSLGQVLGGAGDPRVQPSEVGEQISGQSAQCGAQWGAWPDAAQRLGRGLSRQSTTQPGRDESDQQGVQPVDGLGANKVVAVLGQRPQPGDRLVDLDGVQHGGGLGGDTD
jgi:hypothetical protein